MKRSTTIHRNGPGDRSDAVTPSARHTSASGTPQSTMDTTKQLTGLAKKGGALVGGQMAATVITEQGLNMAGQITAEGTVGRTAGRIGVPMLLGLLGLSFSKKEIVQMASYGAISAGTQAAANTLLGTNRPAFFPGESSAQLAGYKPVYNELPPAGGYKELAAHYEPETVYNLVELDQLASA